MNEPINQTAAWRHEYYLNVTSIHSSPTPASGWFEARKSITASVTSPVSGPAFIQYVCTGWTGTGSVSTSGTNTSVTFTIEEPPSITWNWEIQYPFLQIVLSFVGIVLAVALVRAAWIRTRRRRRVIKPPAKPVAIEVAETLPGRVTIGHGDLD